MKSASNISKTLTLKIRGFFWALGRHAFPLILFLIFIDLIIGGLIFYNYVFLAEQEIPRVTSVIVKFNEKAYQDVLDHLLAAHRQ